jgi:hypothetical protein
MLDLACPIQVSRWGSAERVAIGYATLGHVAALALLFARAWPPNLIGVALSAHT